MISSYLSPLANHLWQSTLFAAVAGMLVLALKKNRAQVRHGLWLAASVKFLIPFSLLVALGSHFGWPAARSTTQLGVFVVPVLMGQISQPFALQEIPVANGTVTTSSPSSVPWLLFSVWLTGLTAVLLFWIVRWNRIRAALQFAGPLRDGNVLDSLRRLERNAGIRRPIRLLSSRAALEPGVFGVFFPVLLLPSGISEHLKDTQLEAILAHELAHVRRRDNLAAALHMLVEAVFWFHPLVWWLGSRLVDERERACDEEVLRMSSNPEAYAEGILHVCEFYIQPSLTCVSGVTGSNLKKRIEAIMSNRIAVGLNRARKVALAVAGTVALGAPIVVGMIHAPLMRAQTQGAVDPHPNFEVVSIKACKAGDAGGGGGRGGGGGGSLSPGRLNLNCQTVRDLIATAYVLYANGQSHRGVPFSRLPISGGPAWINSERYTINARAEGTPSEGMMFGPMLQTLLEDRLKLRIHRESTEVPVYSLTIVKSGLKLQRAEEGSCTPRDLTKSPQPRLEPGQKPFCGTARLVRRNGPNFTWEVYAMNLDEFSKWLNLSLDRLVIDKTGITGRFDFHLEFASDETTPGLLPGGGDPGGTPGAAPLDPAGPSIFTALQQQLGLKLEPAKGPGESLVIDHVERPSKN